MVEDHAYQEPAGREYRARRIYRAGESVEPLWAPGSLMAVAELLGQPRDDEPDGRSGAA